MYNKEALKELKFVLKKRFPKEIEKIILFGSRAENKESEHSDYDLLLIVNRPVNSSFEEEILDITYEIILKYDIMADLKFISNSNLNSVEGTLPFIQNALSRGIVI